MVRDFVIGDEFRPKNSVSLSGYLLKVMDVLSLGALREHVVVYVNAAAIADFGQFRLDVKDEGAKLTDVDRATFIELLG